MRTVKALLLMSILGFTGCGLNEMMAYEQVDWLSNCEFDEFTATSSCSITTQFKYMRYPEPNAYTVALRPTSDGENVMITITNNSNGYFRDGMLQVRVGPNEIIDLYEGNQLFSNQERGILIAVPSKETGDLMLTQMSNGSDAMFRVNHMMLGVLTMEVGLRGFNEAWMSIQ